MTLNRYDTGEVLEPVLWNLSQHTDDLDRIGKVDFDDEESTTWLTAQALKGSDLNDGYQVCIDTIGVIEPAQTPPSAEPQVSITLDGAEALFVDENDAIALEQIIDLAQRGRDDFCQQASYGDYSEDDIDAAEEQWHTATEMIEKIQRIVNRVQDPT